MTRRFARGWVAFTLLLAASGGCGDDPPASTTRKSPAITEFNKGVECAEREDWDTAISRFTEAIRLKPDYAKPGTALDFEVTVEAQHHLVDAKVVKHPFFDPERKKA